MEFNILYRRNAGAVDVQQGCAMIQARPHTSLDEGGGNGNGQEEAFTESFKGGGREGRERGRKEGRRKEGRREAREKKDCSRRLTRMTNHESKTNPGQSSEQTESPVL